MQLYSLRSSSCRYLVVKSNCVQFKNVTFKHLFSYGNFNESKSDIIAVMPDMVLKTTPSFEIYDGNKKSSECEEGKICKANFRDPTVGNVDDTSMSMLNGLLLKAETLQQVAPYPRLIRQIPLINWNYWTCPTFLQMYNQLINYTKTLLLMVWIMGKAKI